MNLSICLASNISHPPTFEQMNKSRKDGDSFNMELLEAFQYSSEDIELLKQKGNINYIIAAAYQLDQPSAINLLMDYLSEIKKNYLGLSLLISCSLREETLNTNLPIELLSKRLIKQSPNNSYAYYLMAYYYAKINNFEKCITYTNQATNASFFNNHWAEYSENSISTSMFLGYSKLAAQMHAIGLQHDVIIYYRLAKYILKSSPDRKNAMLCKKMGTILKKHSTNVLWDYVSIGILKISLEQLKDTKNIKNELSTIEDLKAHLSILTESLKRIGETYDISEKRWELYYTDLYRQSEHYAIKKLMKEFPLTLKEK